MAWSWIYESDAGAEVGRSQTFENRSDAETWIGEAFADLVEDGIGQVRLLDGDTEVYGPMSLHPEA